MLPIAIGWTARVGGWALLLGLAIYTLANHQGMEVRGQVARLMIPLERDDALAVLLRRAGLEGVPGLVWHPDSMSSYWTPFTTLVPKPCHLSLEVTGLAGMPGVSKLFVFFNADGEPAGAPVEWTHLFPLPENAGHFMEQIVDETDPTFLIVRDYRRPPATAGVGPNTLEVYYRIYRLDREESPNVLTIMYTLSRKGGLLLQVEPDRHDRTAFELVTYGTTGQPAGSAVATFVWDSQSERFIEPPPDPQGRWRVVD